MSGGVDSSVSALLLQQQGYQVEGLFMKNWEEDDGSDYCTAIQDCKDAQSVCDTLCIPLHIANFSYEYWEEVFEVFLAEYKKGRTPNPDVLCNKEIKFKAFMDYACSLGADYIATGHYARFNYGDHPNLMKGLDPNKDQSYFLYAVSADKLNKTLFPVGALQKNQVRALAKQYNLKTYNKKDSTGICFIGERRFQEFLKTYLPAEPGLIRTTEGKVIGNHTGLIHYTTGQRQGIGLGGVKGMPEAPWYVIDKQLESNTLVVCQDHNHPMLMSKTLEVTYIHWISPQSTALPATLHAKIRYRQQEQPCTLEQNNKNSYCITFHQPQRAVTPGQSIVFYSHDICLGGAVIERYSPVTPIPTFT